MDPEWALGINVLLAEIQQSDITLTNLASKHQQSVVRAKFAIMGSARKTVLNFDFNRT